MKWQIMLYFTDPEVADGAIIEAATLKDALRQALTHDALDDLEIVSFELTQK